MKIAVYLGSAYGKDPAFKQTAIDVGRWIAKNGHTLVYGGAKVGMMGELARSCKKYGGTVIGVLPKFMTDIEKQELSIDELILTETMSERRLKMIELSDYFVALPGGIGTLDELSEVITNLRLHLISGKMILVNTNGYYEALKSFFEKMVEEGFYEPEEMEYIRFVNSVEEIGGIIC